MEKVKLNNQIVSMRKYVKQAKVHVINKLTKQIKLLQNRKGSETKVQKAKRKAQRFLEAVVIVKKIKPDHVSKLVLSRAKDWKCVLQQKNSTLYDRCIAMLANYGAVQKEVEAFCNANKELVLKISDYFAQWEEKNKLEKDLPKTNKPLPIKKSSKNIQNANLKNESLLSSNKSELKTLLETKSDDEKNDTALISVNVEKLALESKNLNSADAKRRIGKNSNKHKNPIKRMKKSEYLCSDKDNSIELDNRDQESEYDEDNEEEGINNNSLNKCFRNVDESNSEEDEKFDNNNVESESNENEEEKEITSNSLSNNEEVTKDSSDEDGDVNKMQKSISEFDSQLKMNTNTRNKMKAIAQLNLDELEGLDEIPVGNAFGNDECSEEESSEEEINEGVPNKNSDPFFLGHNKEESLQNQISDPFFLENKKDSFLNKNSDPFFLGHNKDDFNSKELDDSSTDSDGCIRTKDSADSFEHKAQYVKKSFPHRKNDKFSPKEGFQKSSYNHRKDGHFNSKKGFQKSLYNHRKDNHFNSKKGFQKSSYNQSKDDHFSPKKSFQKSSYNHRKDGELGPKKSFQESPYNQRNVSNRFKSEEYDEKSFKKDKFASREYHNKFQERDVNKSRKDFKQERKSFPSRDMHNKQSNFISKSSGKKKDNILPKSKMAFKKGNANEHLHPSWEAKRKQKELLSTSFQGKRMVFND